MHGSQDRKDAGFSLELGKNSLSPAVCLTSTYDMSPCIPIRSCDSKTTPWWAEEHSAAAHSTEAWRSETEPKEENDMTCEHSDAVGEACGGLKRSGNSVEGMRQTVMKSDTIAEGREFTSGSKCGSGCEETVFGSAGAVTASDNFISSTYDDTDRSSSPFIVLDHAEDGGCLAYRGTVDPVVLPLQEEHTNLTEQLMKLRATEQDRRWRLYESGRTKANKRKAPAEITVGWRHGDNDYPDTTHADDGHMDGKDPRHSSDEDDERGNSVSREKGSVKGARGFKDSSKGGGPIRSRWEHVESDEDEPYFTRHLDALDRMMHVCSVDSGKVNQLRSSGEYGSEHNDNVASASCSEEGDNASNGCYVPLPMDDTGQMEYVFNSDDAVKRLEFRRQEYEMQETLRRIETKIEALAVARLNRGIHYWQSDDSTESCPRCGKIFSITVRRHHCRRCGVLLCNDCCSQVGRDMYVQVSAADIRRPDPSPLQTSPKSSCTTGDATDNVWMLDAYDFTSHRRSQLSERSSQSGSSHAGRITTGAPATRNVHLVNTGRHGHRGRGGLKVRVVPWVRICNACHLACLRARLEGDYSPILGDGRRRFHVLKEEEQSLLCINNTWETRWAQLSVLKHLVMEKTVHIAHDQVQHATGVVSNWVRNWRLSVKQ
uniref:Putative zinc finger protein n=1 Tax=Trypanosoma congolense (strain IL3000) TaxID=1068625 RepID=G0UYT9_TRYCI|nr:putative zinc finger protein [Trypanosoma congolense IL3000]